MFIQIVLNISGGSVSYVIILQNHKTSRLAIIVFNPFANSMHAYSNL